MADPYKVFIPTSGTGSRLGPFTSKMNKPLVSMFLNAVRVAWQASTAQHNVGNQHLDLIKQTSRKRS